jgi:hypothetical protein
MKTTFILLIAITEFALPLRAQDGAQLEQVISNGFSYRNLGFGFQQGSDGETRPGPSSQLREIPPGEYDVTLQMGDKKLTQKARVLP